MKMDENIYIGILCLDFDEAKKFYIENLGFKSKFNEKTEIQSEESRRTILLHALALNLEIEFIAPTCLEEANRIGESGGTINLLTLPTHNIDSLKNKLENTLFFINYIETPYASFLTVEDPMGNNICLYERA